MIPVTTAIDDAKGGARSSSGATVGATEITPSPWTLPNGVTWKIRGSSNGELVMLLTLGQAAKETGRSKPTILNAINKGRVSARKSATGAWEIEPAELFRVYGRVEPLNGEDGAEVRIFETPSPPPV